MTENTRKSAFSIMNRMLAVLLSVLLAVAVIRVIPAGALETPAAQKRTVIFYADGANLEEMAGYTTWNLVQAMEAQYDENLDFIVMTGGSNTWGTEAEYLVGAEAVDTTYNQVWKLEGKRENEEHGKMTLLEPTGIAGFESAYMTDPEMLTAFINYCFDNYPADQYDLILWDHGGGFTGGYGDDYRLDTENGLSMSELMSAFEATKLTKAQKKFEIINFDACDMATVEVIAALEPYADYLVASAEDEQGYGQEYTTWLNAVKEKPEMNGFELGKAIVDATIDFYCRTDFDSYDVSTIEATLAVIDTENFKERLLGELIALDNTLVNEAKNAGRRNNRFNFYDEIYALSNAYKYAQGDISCYDLGNYVGSMSALQSEMDNYTASQISTLRNVYTDFALRILSVLRDNDNSGDDVIYARANPVTKRTIEGYNVRGLDGEFATPDENGHITVTPTGMSIFAGDTYIGNVDEFVKEAINVLPLVKDETVREFFKKRAAASSLYSLIFMFGIVVSYLSITDVKYISWRAVENTFQTVDPDTMSIVDKLTDTLVELGEFESKDEAKDYYAAIVAQQAMEVISSKKATVRRVAENGVLLPYFKVDINNASAQSLMKVISGAHIEVNNYRSEYFDYIFKEFYGDEDINDVFPDGIVYSTATYDGELDYNVYFEDFYDSTADILRRVYSSSSSSWIVPEMSANCFVMYDAQGGEHPAQIQYIDVSKKKALVPVQFVLPNLDYFEGSLVISQDENNVWTVDGLAINSQDSADRTNTPMDSDYFNGACFAPMASVRDSNGNAYDFPISQFIDIDTTVDKWGLSFGWKNCDEVAEIEDTTPYYFVTDVYSYAIDISPLFEEANEAAEQGEVVNMINGAEITVAEAVYNGFEQTPEVTVVFNGRTLEETVDYKVLYDGSVLPGTGYVAVIGLGDFTGVTYVPYEIKCVVHVLDHVEAKPARNGADGNTEYWQCKYCGKCFADEKGENEISADAVVIKYVAPADDVDGDGEITDADAVYLLFYTFFPEEYPVNGSVDYDGDGKVTDADAVYLLFYTFFPEDYPIG